MTNQILPSLKAVTAITSFKVVILQTGTNRKDALLDQDGDIVGLISSEKPFLFNSARYVSKPLNQGATYKGYPARHLMNNIYVLDNEQENREDSTLGDRADDIIQMCEQLLKSMSKR